MLSLSSTHKNLKTDIEIRCGRNLSGNPYDINKQIERYK